MTGTTNQQALGRGVEDGQHPHRRRRREEREERGREEREQERSSTRAAEKQKSRGAPDWGKTPRGQRQTQITRRHKRKVRNSPGRER